MKANVLAGILFLLFAACTSQNSGQLSPQQKDRIVSEVSAVADTIWSKWEQMDPEGALRYSWDSPEWMSYNSAGTRYDFQAYRKLAAEFKGNASTYKWATTRRDFPFVSENLVVCSWVGKDEAVWKSGDKFTCDPHAYTLVFRKIAGEWRLAYSHDSGIGVTQQLHPVRVQHGK